MNLIIEYEQVKSLKKGSTSMAAEQRVLTKNLESLADCLEPLVVEKGGFQMGFFALAEKEWIDTLIAKIRTIIEAQR